MYTHTYLGYFNSRVDVLKLADFKLKTCTQASQSHRRHDGLCNKTGEEEKKKKLYFSEQHPLWAQVVPTISECHLSISAGTRRLVVKWLFIVAAETRKPLVVGESVYFIPSACVCDCFESQQNKGDSSLGFIFRTSLI